MLNSRPRLFLLLLLVFLANCGETWYVTSSHPSTPITPIEYKTAYAVHQFERGVVDFDFHDRTVGWGMYAYSISYFLLFPVTALGVLVALARRRAIAPVRVFCLAVTAAYLVSLPWFLLFPVPERWAYPEARAMLLSDDWSAALINAIRPIKAVNNAFPSYCTAFAVIVISVCWRFHIRLRHTVTALGLSAIVAAFALGIDWLAGIGAGALVGLLSVVIALRLTDTPGRSPRRVHDWSSEALAPREMP